MTKITDGLNAALHAGILYVLKIVNLMLICTVYIFKKMEDICIHQLVMYVMTGRKMRRGTDEI